MVRWTTYIISSKAYTLCLIRLAKCLMLQISPGWAGLVDQVPPQDWIWSFEFEELACTQPWILSHAQSHKLSPASLSLFLGYIFNRILTQSYRLTRNPGFLFQTKQTLTHKKPKNECFLTQCIFRFSLRKWKLGLSPCRIWGETIKQTSGVKSSLF